MSLMHNKSNISPPCIKAFLERIDLDILNHTYVPAPFYEEALLRHKNIGACPSHQPAFVLYASIALLLRFLEKNCI